MSKYFGTPFAESGTKTAIPDAAQAGGEVSYAEGYTIDYTLDQASNQNAKDIEIDKFNHLANDLSGAIKDIQEQGILAYRADVNHPVGAVKVGSDGKPYQCLIANGIDSTVVDPVGDTTGTWKRFFADSYAKITDTKASGLGGGAFTSGAWQTRTLNTKDSDDDLIVTLAANQFTLQAGKYRIRASAPAYEVGGHKIRLRNITDSSTEIIGSSAYFNFGLNVMTHSFLSGELTIASAKTFELQHHCQATDASGFGVDLDGGGENAVYATIEIWRL